MRLLIFFAVPLCLVLGTSGCSPESEVREGGGRTMGTTWSLQARSPLSQRLLASVQERLDAWEAVLSHWQADSAVSRFNASRSTEWQEVPPELAEVVALAQQTSAETSHALDITVAPLVDLWGFGAKGHRATPPTDAEVAATMKLCGWQHLHSRLSPPALRKDIPALQINASAVTEGWALDKLAANLEAQGVREFLLEIGGEVLARGRWTVGVQDPAAAPGQAGQMVVAQDQCVATSGVYRQHFRHGGQDYAHVLDPRTGRPVEHTLASVTVLHASAAQADALATALLVLGPVEGRRVAERMGLDVIWFERLK